MRPFCKSLSSSLRESKALGSNVPDMGAFFGVFPTAAAAVPGRLAFVYGLMYRCNEIGVS